MNVLTELSEWWGGSIQGAKRGKHLLATLPGLQPEPFDYATRDLDPYWKIAQAALDQIAAILFPEGVWEWLEHHQNALYTELQDSLPAEIDRLWDNSAPLQDFEIVLERWVNAHRDACKIFKCAQFNQKDVKK